MIAIDPGNNAGVAVFKQGVLIRADFVVHAVARNWKWDGPTGRRVVCEVPQHYRGASSSTKRNLRTLEKTARYLVSQMKPSLVQMVKPCEWKGQRPKGADNRYTLSLLSAAEKKIAGSNHNVLDAIGIGLWALGRR